MKTEAKQQQTEEPEQSELSNEARYDRIMAGVAPMPTREEIVEYLRSLIEGECLDDRDTISKALQAIRFLKAAIVIVNEAHVPPRSEIHTGTMKQ